VVDMSRRSAGYRTEAGPEASGEHPFVSSDSPRVDGAGTSSAAPWPAGTAGYYPIGRPKNRSSHERTEPRRRSRSEGSAHYNESLMYWEQTKTQTLLRKGAMSLAEDLQFSEAGTRVHLGPPKAFALGCRLDMQLRGCIK
jgi:hypothetical protein